MTDVGEERKNGNVRRDPFAIEIRTLPWLLDCRTPLSHTVAYQYFRAVQP